MPKGKWTPPPAGDAPQEVKDILKKAYSDFRDKHPAENPATKAKGAKIAWGAVANAGWHKNKEGKWVKKMKKQKEMSEEIVIDAFKAGDYPQGKFGAKELSEISATYNPQNYEAPILIGHLSDPSYKGKSAIPAYGWIGAVKVVGDHLKLVASQFSEQLKGFIKEGFYKKVSAAFFQPDDPNNPTPGKWHLHHLAFLGGTPPAVKGLEQLAFAEIKCLGIEFAETDAQVSIDGEAIDAVEEIGTEDTLKDMTEACGTFLGKAEEALKSDTDDETRKTRINLAVMDLQIELQNCASMHFMFEDKLENIEEHAEGEASTELSEKKSLLTKLWARVHTTNQQRKEREMDALKEKEFTDKISSLEAQVKEFTEKERVANEAKLAADKAAVEAAAKAKDDALVAEIKTFCEQAIKDNLMTPAIREKDEPIMLSLGKTSPEALKAFQQKYDKPVVPAGEALGTDPNTANDTRALVIQRAEKYVTAHKADKEFAGLSAADAVNRAVYLHDIKRSIKFEGE